MIRKYSNEETIIAVKTPITTLSSFTILLSKQQQVMEEYDDDNRDDDNDNQSLLSSNTTTSHASIEDEENNSNSLAQEYYDTCNIKFTSSSSSSSISTIIKVDDDDDSDIDDDDSQSISMTNQIVVEEENSNTSFFLSSRNYDSNQIMNYSEQMIEDRIRESSILNELKDKIIMNAKDDEAVLLVPTIDEKELLIGRILGHGGFCYVQEVNLKASQQQIDSNDNNNNNRDPFPYAVKRLKPKMYNDASDWIQSIYDFYMEVQYLSILQHPHIISVIATSTSSCITNPCPFHEDGKHLFIVFEKLNHTLLYRINKVWKKHNYHNTNKKNLIKVLFDIGGKKENQCFMKRLKYAYDLAQAIQYLHEKRMIYRDIKPDNIGFDSNDVIKMFDFGLMKECNPKHCISKVDGISYYPYTAQTGSFIYMDPYVATGKPYNELCDAYSFCILLWQMIELEVPYKGYNMRRMRKKVWISNSDKRPNLCAKHWSTSSLQQMITNGWSYDYTKRPNMKSICNTLYEILNESSNKNRNSSIRTKSKSEGASSLNIMNESNNNNKHPQNITTNSRPSLVRSSQLSSIRFLTKRSKRRSVTE